MNGRLLTALEKQDGDATQLNQEWHTLREVNRARHQPRFWDWYTEERV
ncbi:hypothetical protein DNAM5_149 [Haloarcula californiae tailed virus 1]|uniref:Uncharacterized protein n=1 Tax=Haloarcula californiae tailed virus 1 TaxID=1273746 RepID=R4TI36_9CAUD|nr:hypothetical protein M202_gp072 [Haloarcula californiae tailed virus 1]AGM12006.1 hypothetical protein DNAM5_149 [Haloarcula californiae tailed virus 1]